MCDDFSEGLNQIKAAVKKGKPYQTVIVGVPPRVAEGIKPIREAYEGLSDAEVAQVMASSAERARDMADGTIAMVREATGLT